MGSPARASSAATYKQVAPRQWLVAADHVSHFLRDVSKGAVKLDQRVDLNPLDPRGTGFEGALPNAGATISASTIDKLLTDEGHFFRVLDEYASDTWGEGWRLESDDARWVEEANLIAEALNLRARFHEGDLQHLAHGLAGVYINLEEANAEHPELEPASVRKFTAEGGVLTGVFAVQAIPRKAIVKAIIEEDPKEPRFREARAWVLRLKRGKGSEGNVEVHWSRFIPFRQNAKPGHEWDGLGLGRRCVDSALMSRNMEHSAAGAYYQRASPLLIIEFSPGAMPDQPTIDAIGDEVDELQRHDIQKLMALGFTVKALGEGSDLPDPGPFQDVALKALSIDSGIPKPILEGSPAGELASASEDTRRWNKRITRRRTNWAGPDVVREFYQRLDAWGVLALPKKGYKVAWTDLGEPTAAEAMSNEVKRATALRLHADLGDAPPAVLTDYEPGEFQLQKVPFVPLRVATPTAPGQPPAAERGRDALPPGAKIMVPELRLVEQRFAHALREALLDIGEALLARLEEAAVKAAGSEPGVVAQLRARAARSRAALVPLLTGDAAFDAAAIQQRAQRLLVALDLDPDDPAVKLLLGFTAPSDDLSAAIEEAFRIAAETGARGTFRDLGREPIEELLDESTIRVFRTVARSTGEATAASITAEIRRSVADGLAQGEGHAQLRDRVLATFDRLARYEAERIARSESMSAYNAGAKHTLRALGIERWRFRTFDAACPVCAPLDGAIFAVNDATAPSPPRHPNCRCLTGAVPNGEGA